MQGVRSSLTSFPMQFNISLGLQQIVIVHTGAGSQHLAAVGTWTMQLLLLSLPDMQLLREEQLGGEVMFC